MDAHRAFIIFDRRFRPAAVNSPRFFAAGAASGDFFSAYLSVWASLIRRRDSGLNFLPGGRPRFFAGADAVLLPPISRRAERARSNRVPVLFEFGNVSPLASMVHYSPS